MTHDFVPWALAALLLIMALGAVKQAPQVLKVLGLLIAAAVVMTMLIGVLGLQAMGGY